VRKRQRLLATVLGAGLCLSAPASLAAQNVVLVTGAFRRSVPVSDIDQLARTGQAQGLLADLLKLSHQQPDKIAKLLNESVALPVVTVSRLLNTRIGEAILERVAKIVYPLKTPGAGVPALRSAVVLGLANNNGKLSAVSFLQAYPGAEMEVNIPALLNLARKVASLSDLMRFFSESPLEGLTGGKAKEG